MSIFIDKKYINLISCHFDKFKWKSDKLANCRCKFCGDSSKHKNKARGYFFVKNNSFFYKCHNCGIGYNVYNVLQNISPSLCKEYTTESYLNGDVKAYKPKQQIIQNPNQELKLNIENINDLSSSHKARLYVESRKIPTDHWCNIGYVNDFKQLAESFDDVYKDRFFKEDRLIITIKSPMGICAIQGRSFSKMSKMKYITLKKENRNCYYNYDKIDLTKPFYVFEGPINSMFVPNSIATLGMSNMKMLEEKIDDTNAIYVVDNQPNNKEVVTTIDYLISKNKKCCIFPKNIKYKDINDMVLAGLDVCDIIQKNVHVGLEAKLVFNNWKKI